MIRIALVVCGLFLASCSKGAPGSCATDSQCNPGLCCSGQCVDVSTSTLHCGACFNGCGAQNGAASCFAGACSISCASGFGDCNKMAKDGCETELASTVNHCGACATACSSANSTQVCERSHCLQSSCDPGFGDCNANDGDGCEVDLNS